MLMAVVGIRSIVGAPAVSHFQSTVLISITCFPEEETEAQGCNYGLKVTQGVIA